MSMMVAHRKYKRHWDNRNTNDNERFEGSTVRKHKKRLLRYYRVADRAYEWFLLYVREFIYQHETLGGRLRMRTWRAAFECVKHLNAVVRTSKINFYYGHEAYDTWAKPAFFPNFDQNRVPEYENEGDRQGVALNNLPQLEDDCQFGNETVGRIPDRREPGGDEGPAGRGIPGGPGASSKWSSIMAPLTGEIA